MDKIEVETQNNTSASETKIDISDNMKEHGEEIEKIQSKTKDDIFVKTEMHRKSIHQIFVSQYMDNTEYGSDDYIVTYSKKDKSVLGWSIKENGPQPDVYFKIDEISMLVYSILSKKILLLSTMWDLRLIDLNSDRTSSDQFLKLKEYQVLFGAFGFLPNGDLIYASAIDCKIYKYHFTDKPKNTVSWEYSQIIDIEIPESLNGQVKLAIYQTKLFLNIDNNSKMFQFDLLTMNLEKKYHEFTLCSQDQIAVNKNQTLLAIRSREGTINIYSMENGMLICKCGKSEYNIRIKFITLRNTERLAICCQNYSKLVDPYQIYDEIDISENFNNTSVITKLNRKIFIDNGNVCVTNGISGIDENKLQQLSNKTIYRNSIYTLSTFKIIQSMLNEIIDQDEIKESYLKVKINNYIFYKINLNEYSSLNINIETKTKSETICASDSTFSIKLLNNQDLVVINMHGISIYTLNENMIERYFWHNNEWKNFSEKFDPGNVYDIIQHFKPLIGKILQNEFDDSKHSIPFPTFIIDYEKCLKDIFPSIRMDKYYRRNRRNIFEDVYRRDIVEDVINEVV